MLKHIGLKLKIRRTVISITALLVFYLVAVRFFSYNYTSEELLKILNLLIVAYILYFVLFLKKSKYQCADYGNVVLGLAFVPFVSCISCWVYHDQSPMATAYVTRGCLIWLFYFWFHHYRISTKTLIFILVLLGCCNAFICLVQQFTFPYVLFGLRAYGETDDEIIVEELYRNGLVRFRVAGYFYCFVALFWAFEKLIRRKTAYSICLFLIGIVGVYLSLTRQIWIAALIPFLFFPFITKMGTLPKFAAVMMVSIGIIAIVMNLDTVVGKDLLDETQSQLNDNGYVRWKAYYFWGVEYWHDPINILMGNGMHHLVPGNEYAQFVDSIYRRKIWIHADIGIVGDFSRYGLFYVIAVFALYRKIFLNRKCVPLFLLMLTIASLTMIFTNTWTNQPMLLSAFLYLMDKYKYENRYSHLKLQQYRRHM